MQEVARLLASVCLHGAWISQEVELRPASGRQLLYRKKEGASGAHYKQDGYLWKTRKDGKLPREDHMKLKVKGLELIYATYVHSALVPTFHRRAYSLLSVLAVAPVPLLVSAQCYFIICYCTYHANK